MDKGIIIKDESGKTIIALGNGSLEVEGEFTSSQENIQSEDKEPCDEFFAFLHNLRNDLDKVIADVEELKRKQTTTVINNNLQWDEANGNESVEKLFNAVWEKVKNNTVKF